MKVKARFEDLGEEQGFEIIKKIWDKIWEKCRPCDDETVFFELKISKIRKDENPEEDEHGCIKFSGVEVEEDG